MEDLASTSMAIELARTQSHDRPTKRRNRIGCLTCRRRYVRRTTPITDFDANDWDRRKRCDGTREVCGHCSRLNLVCCWQQPRDLGMPVSPRPMSGRTATSATQIAPTPTNFLHSDSKELSSRSLDRRLAMRYYIQAFNAMLTTNLENNGFLTGA